MTRTIKIASIGIIEDTNEVEVKYLVTVTEEDTVIVNGALHTEVYDIAKKEKFIADVENPAFGGVVGASQEHLILLGWN